MTCPRLSDADCRSLMHSNSQHHLLVAELLARIADQIRLEQEQPPLVVRPGRKP